MDILNAKEDMEEKKSKAGSEMTQWLIFAIYAVFLILIACFHEPWYDEAEAWQMARGASLSEILFQIPHYEGHPALWYLILAIFAKTGVPYELGLKGIACFAALCYGWLILFRSPFPKLIRYFLPFHYFFFYQYGIISRPYGLSVLCLLLMAMTYREKNKKPFRFLLPMAFLCALSGYGIVLAGGICIAWLYEICRNKGWKLFTIDFWKDKRILGLFLLLILAVAIILEIMPKADTYATSQSANNSLFTRLLYTIFVMLPDSTVLTVLEGAAFLSKAQINALVLLIGILIGVVMLSAMISLASKENLRYLLIPYVLFAGFAAVVYFCAHHMGMLLAFAVFWLWIACEDPSRGEIGKKLWAKIKIEEQDKITLRKLGMFGLGVLIVIPLYWTIAASVLEVTRPYYYGRDMAAFLKDTGLYQAKVMAEYDVALPEEGVEDQDDVYRFVNTALIARPIAALPYFEHNFVQNLNMGQDSGGYALHRMPSADENKEVLKKWREMGMPEVVIGPMNLEYVFGKEANEVKYVPVYRYHPFAEIWKAFTSKYNIVYQEFIYVRSDLVEQYGLTPIDIFAN